MQGVLLESRRRTPQLAWDSGALHSSPAARARATLLAAILCLVLGTAGAQAQSLADFDGSFAYEASADKQTEFDTAIDGVVAPLNFLLRPIARARLTSSNRPYEQIRFQVQPEGLTIARGPDLVWTSKVDNSPTAVTRHDGLALVVRRRFETGEVIETIDSDTAQRLNRYALSPDGQTLSLTVEIVASQLPRALVYTHRYRRTPPSR